MRGIVSIGLATLLLAGEAGANKYRYPLDATKGTVSAYFDHSGQDWNCGSKRYSGHKGSDFYGSKGTPIYAAAAGTVVYVNDGCDDSCTSGACGCGGGFGNYVKLQHADGNFTYCAHMQIWSVKVKVNDTVTCGQLIGNMGSSGNSTGNHLHFEVRVPTTSQDPFSGPCSGPTSLWVNQGSYLGRPGTSCASPPPPDTGPPPDLKPKADTKPPSPPGDAGRRDGKRPPGSEGGAPPSDGAVDGPPLPPWSEDPSLRGSCTAVPGAAAPLALSPLLLPFLLLLAARRRR